MRFWCEQDGCDEHARNIRKPTSADKHTRTNALMESGKTWTYEECSGWYCWGYTTRRTATFTHVMRLEQKCSVPLDHMSWSCTPPPPGRLTIHVYTNALESKEYSTTLAERMHRECVMDTYCAIILCMTLCPRWTCKC